MSVFGFSTEPTGGDFLPIIKYDARAGRIFRVDRGIDGPNPTDITDTFTAVFDFANIETGWMNFSGPVPDFKLVRMGTVLPVRPSENHKNGIRLLLKLHPSCAGPDRPIREFSTSAKAALRGLEKLYLDYQQQAKGDQLPIVQMKGSTPIKTGVGDRQSTNYVPKFEIVGWCPRPSDLVYIARGSSGPSQNALPLTPPHAAAMPPTQVDPTWTGGNWTGGNGAPPATGSTRVQAPLERQLQASVAHQPTAADLANDFG